MIISKENLQIAACYCPAVGCIYTATLKDTRRSLILGALTAAGLFSIYAITTWNSPSLLRKGLAIGATILSPASTAAYFTAEKLLNRSPLLAGKIGTVCKIGAALLASPLNTVYAGFLYAKVLHPDSEEI
ncbi:MAG: hypothetical protein ACOYK9_05420 [Chlamydiia bacterium]